MRTFLFCIVISLIASIAKADLNQLSNSICRINTGKALATGFTYKEDKDYYYILTAGHTTGIDTEPIKINLYHSAAFREVEAEKIYFTYHGIEALDSQEILDDKIGPCNDVSVLKVKKSALESIGYPKFELVTFGLNYEAKPNTLIWTYGCSDGNWPSGFKGRLLSLKTNLMRFSPPSIVGRSGSPIMDHECKKVVGLLTLCDGIQTTGTRIDIVYEMLKKEGLAP